MCLHANAVNFHWTDYIYHKTLFNLWNSVCFCFLYCNTDKWVHVKINQRHLNIQEDQGLDLKIKFESNNNAKAKKGMFYFRRRVRSALFRAPNHNMKRKRCFLSLCTHRRTRKCVKPPQQNISRENLQIALNSQWAKLFNNKNQK